VDWFEQVTRDECSSLTWVALVGLSCPDFFDCIPRQARLWSHQAAAREMQHNELFKTFEVRREVTGIYVRYFSGHLIAI